MNIPQNYHILFLQGGASQQFAMVPMNLMDKTADYAVTGVWAKKAFAEAKVIGTPRAVFSSEETKFSRCPNPNEIKVDPSASYLHITTNNTIYGSEYHSFPDAGNVPIVADMSSDIAARELDMSKFGLVYAGAQKNLGPSGVTVVIIRSDLVERSYRPLPVIFNYSSHVKENSLYNTPPVVAVYLMNLVFKWMKKSGGIKAIEKNNREKAAIIYDAIDRSSFYKSNIEKTSRSLMNIAFTLPSDELTEKFLAGAKALKMVGLKGHRSTGGIRASIYNAFPKKGCEALANFMKEFERAQ
jgi:phosphoserine aminotransferase